MANVGTIDRLFRFVAGIVLFALAFMPQTAPSLGGWTWALAAVGAVLIGTAAIKFCPAYRLLGLRTCPLR